MTAPVQEIRSISRLYCDGLLFAADLDELPEPSQSFNNRVATVTGDITKLEIDVIINAANKNLKGGGGVDGAIHRAAGPDLLTECQSLGGCDTGSAKITDAYLLPCKKVIHAVGPRFYDTREEICAQLLADCYTKCLELAVENDCKSIAFCSLSTGIYGYPFQAAALVAIKTVREFLEGESGDKLEKIVFCTFQDEDVEAYNDNIPLFFPPTEYDLTENGAAAGVSDGETLEPHGEEGVELESSESSKEKSIIENLPDVPTKEPSDEGPATKKRKPSNDGEGL